MPARLVSSDRTCEEIQSGNPTALQDELKINPFLRVDAPQLQKFTGKSGPVEVLAALRRAKDNF